MGRPRKELPVTSSIVPAVVRRALALGLDVETLSLRYDLDEGVEARESATVAADVPNAICEELERAGDLDVASAVDGAFRRAAAGRETSLDDLTAIAVHRSATLQVALERQARWTSLLHSELAAECVEDPSAFRFVVRASHRPRGVGRFVDEIALVRAMRRAREAMNAPLRPMRVWFAHARPRDPSALLAFFDVREIAFGEGTSGFSILPSEARRATAHPDPAVADAFAEMIDARVAPPASESFAAAVERAIASELPAEIEIEAISKKLHVSSRTLQRRLEFEGTRFADVEGKTRRALAERLLADPSLSLADVATRAGFSELATFSRAFKRWTGTSPGRYRHT